MKALVYQGPDKKALEERPVPKLNNYRLTPVGSCS